MLLSIFLMLSEGGQWILVSVIALVVWLIIRASATAPGVTLNNKFVELGDFTKKSLDEVIQKVGEPTGVTYLHNAQKVCTWSKPGYTITLTYTDAGVFVKLNSEIKK